MTKRIDTIADLKPDPENARKHNPRNLGMIVDALHSVGAALLWKRDRAEVRRRDAGAHGRDGAGAEAV